MSRGRHRGPGDPALLPPDGEGEPEPGPPAAPGPGRVAPAPDDLEGGAVPDQLVLVPRQDALPRGPPAAGGVTEHVAGVVGQLDDAHPPTMDRDGLPCQGSGHADGGDGRCPSPPS